jgi:Zn-dependent protease
MSPNSVSDEPKLAEDLDAVTSEMIRLGDQVPPSWSGTLALLFSAGLFLGAQLTVSAPLRVALLIAVLLVHEAGHLLAMRILGYRSLGVLFIPFLGAVARGRTDEPHPQKGAVIALAGPIVGLVSAWCALWFYHWGWGVIFFGYAQLAIVINVFNLLPIRPLDGGSFLSLLFLGRVPWLELLFEIASSGLFIVFVFSRLPSLALAAGLGIALLVRAHARFQIARVVQSLRGRFENALPSVSDVEVIQAAVQARLRDFLKRVRDRPNSIRKRARFYRYLWWESRTPALSPPEAGVLAISGFTALGAIFLLLRWAHPELPLPGR